MASAFNLAQTSGVATAGPCWPLVKATMIAYLDDFLFLLVMTLAALPLLLLVRTPRARVRAGGDRTECPRIASLQRAV